MSVAPNKDSLRRLFVVAFDQQDSFYLIALEALRGSSNTNGNVGCGHREEISGQHGTVTQLDCVMSRSAQLVTNAAAGRIVRSDFNWESACIEALFAEFNFVFPDGKLDDLRSFADFDPVHFEGCTLGNRVDGEGNLLRRSQRPKLGRQRPRDQRNRNRSTRRPNRGLKLDGLPRRYIAQGDVTLANADLVLVVQVERKAGVGDRLGPQVLGRLVRQLLPR